MSRLTFFCDLAEVTTPLPHFWEHTVGSDHARMALRDDWRRQLRFFQGTLAPWAVTASLPFAPEVVLPSLRRLNKQYPEITNEYGFKCSYNPTFTSGRRKGWMSNGYYGLDQGPIIMMIGGWLGDPHSSV